MEISQIQKRIELIEKYSKEIGDAKEMLKEELESNQEYVNLDIETKEAVKKRKEAKDSILASGPNRKLTEEIKHNAQEISLLREILSAELSQYFVDNKTDEIMDSFGETRKFKVLARLLPRHSKKFDDRDSYGKYVPEKPAGE